MNYIEIQHGISEEYGAYPKVKQAGLQKSKWALWKKQRQLLLMALPFVSVVVFSYGPLWGWLMAFKKYSIVKGLLDSPWVGLYQFRKLFQDDEFYQVLRNTLAMSAMSLIFGFVCAIGLALLLNEVRLMLFKRTIQTITYLPHFVSMVVVASIVTVMLSPDHGLLNDLLIWMGIIDEPIFYLSKGNWYWVINTLVGLWKEVGWSSIIYLAVLSGISPELYEAAEVDGASRFSKMWHISIPGIMPTAMILLILATGSLINSGYEMQMLLGNNLTIEYSQVLDLYALNYAFKLGDYSYGAAISIFKSVVSVTLVLIVNAISKRMGQSRVI
ncbi:ABC transporter permease [Paenibacillus sp. HJGM_3]|uniref:ABC transporter permease n=1 Tax=Paenibacillus sp. HJGM_3 TaxID=3379816 RepID=UPI0038594F26